MGFLMTLWLPILLSAVLVFVVSSILHMLLPIHKGDLSKLPAEEQLLESLRSSSLKPGAYMFPCPGSMKEMSSPEMLAKYQQGPVGFLTVLPNRVPNVGKSLVQWFLYSVVVSVFTAYVGKLVLVAGTPSLHVFRVLGAVATLGYAVGVIPDSIWKGQSWCTTFKFVFDGLLYGLATAGVFVWLWP